MKARGAARRNSAFADCVGGQKMGNGGDRVVAIALRLGSRQ
jgi:hypothetical protein